MGTECSVTGTMTVALLLAAVQHPRQQARNPVQGQSQGVGTCHPSPSPLAYFVSGGESGPRLVGPAVIVLSISYLYVVTEADEDLSFPKFFHCGPLTELQEEECWTQSTRV